MSQGVLRSEEHLCCYGVSGEAPEAHGMLGGHPSSWGARGSTCSITGVLGGREHPAGGPAMHSFAAVQALDLLGSSQRDNTALPLLGGPHGSL
jgi:hypothetical protein